MGDRPRPPHLRLTSRRLPDARRLAAVLESLPEAIAVLDADRRIVHHNFRFVEIWGLSPDEVRSATGDEIRERGYELLEDPSTFREGLERLDTEPEGVRVDTARLADGRLVRRELRPRYGAEGLDGWVAVYRDVSDEEAARTELLRSLQRYRLLFESDVVGVFRISPEGELLECNGALAAILGYPDPAAIEGTSVEQLFADLDAKERVESTLEERGTVTRAEIPVRRRDGEVVWVLASATLAREDAPDRPPVVGTAVDVSRRRALERELDLLTRHDPVTGLPNRRVLEERTRRARARADRTGAPFAVVRLELGDVGTIGHPERGESGDRTLVELGRRVQGGLRDTDTGVWLADEAFAVLLGEVEGPEGARRAASRLLEALCRPLRIEGRERDVVARAGVAVYPFHGVTLAELLRSASRAAAEPGAESEAALPDSPGGTAGPGPLTAERLERALREDELVLHYQPIYDLADRSLVGAEALVRWEHPERGVLPAAAFLPLARRSGLLAEIDRLVLRSALRQTAAWIGGRAPRWTGVKLSRRTALQADLAEELDATARAVGVSLDRVVLELDLPELLRSPEGAVDGIARLRSVGCRVALRGLGLDRWTAAQLEHPSPELQAVDMLLLQGEPGPLDPGLLDDIVRHGHELGLVVVAVGIESEDQVTWIGSSGADLALGYALGRPVPPEAFPADDA